MLAQKTQYEALKRVVDTIWPPEAPDTEEAMMERREAFKQQHSLTDAQADSYKATYWGKPPSRPRIEVKEKSDDSWNYYINGLAFTLRRYHSCCGALMLHTFSYTNGPVSQLTDEQFALIMNTVFQAWYGEMYFKNRRIITVMVEPHRTGFEVPSQTLGREGVDARLEEIPAIENPVINYPKFWTYWHNQARVNDRLFYNYNSGAILHDLEVIVK